MHEVLSLSEQATVEGGSVMASSSNNKNSDGGWIGALLGLAIVLAIVVAFLSLVGHVLGLTPSVNDVLGDRPDGWVTRHYRGVIGGYLLTVVAIGVVGALVLFGLMTASDKAEDAQLGRRWFAHAIRVAAVLAVVIVAVPVGKRPGVDTALGQVGPAREGNVPQLVGLSASRAEAKLDNAGLSADWRDYPSDDHHCKVVNQSPNAGGEVDEYGDVKVRCQIRVPDVVGEKARAGESRIDNIGLTSRLINEPYDYSLGRCKVEDQSQHGKVDPSTTIRLRLACVKPEPTPTPAPTPEQQSLSASSNCDPNYSGCLDPNSSDYDCAGGSGDGPDYTGTVTVLGDDRYDLNRDSDNIACDIS
jgi:NADH:ubiquinone oxidoreductase subunit 6 (subunit J)